MKIRFGYVANCLSLWDSSPSKTMTFTRYSTLQPNERFEKLRSITAQNLQNTKRILFYNIAHEIKLYRFSSSIVPLATHPDVMWDFVTPFKAEWEEIGQLIKQYQIRASFHPNQYTLFSSSRDEVILNAIKDMEYHFKMLEAMDIVENGLINIHIGGAYGDKESSLERFHENIKKLPSFIKKQMTLENDDKTYNVMETLKTCELEDIPMVLDFHHYMANKGDVELPSCLSRIFQTWRQSNKAPKVHLSSPKSNQEVRSHADLVSFEFILPFLKIAKELDQDFDIMIEAKQKNLAMHKLIEEIASIRGVKRIASSTVEW